MLSKSRGQYLRVAATLHVLFNWKTPHNIPVTISNEALKAADSFVTMCVQHASYLSGRGELSEAIENVNLLQQGINIGTGILILIMLIIIVLTIFHTHGNSVYILYCDKLYRI